MAQPPDYTPKTSFADDEANSVSGRSTVKTAALDTEFTDIEATLDALNTNIALLQRDDRKLLDGIVEPHTLSTEVRMLLGGGWNPRGLWAAGTAYAVKDVVQFDDKGYVCAAAHTAGASFATDYAAGKWIAISVAASAVTDAQAAATAAATSETNAATSETNAAASETAAANSATAANTSKNAAATSAAAADTDATSAHDDAVSAGASKLAAATSETNAATSETNAAASAVAAASSAGQIVTDNVLINGDFRINQRSFAGGALAAGDYGNDRWKAGSAGANYAVSSGTVTVTSGSIVQVIESPQLASKSVTVSVEDPSADVSVDVEGETGTISSGTGQKSCTVTVPSTSTGNVTLTLSGAASWSNAKIEVGNVATPFEQRPLALELLLCQWYYYQDTHTNTIGTATPNASGVIGVVFNGILPRNMRTTPSVTFTDGLDNSGSVSDMFSAGTSAGSGWVVYFAANGNVVLRGGTGLTAGNGYKIKIYADAEL